VLAMAFSAALLASCESEGRESDDSKGTNESSGYQVASAKVAGVDVSEFSIQIPPDADECMEFSAEELADYIENACGAKLEISSERKGGHVIEYRFDADDEYSLGDEGYNVKVTSDGDVLITCGAKRGCLYATYYLLEKFIGYRFLNAGIEYLYKSDGVELPADFDETEVPAFSYRGLSQIGSEGANFAALRLNAVDATGSGSTDPVNGNNAASYKYGGGVGNMYIHAHSYAYQMAGFEHAYDNDYIASLGLFDTQPCLTSEDTFEKIIEWNQALYDERVTNGNYVPGVHFTMIACSPNDNTDFCTCENCKAVYAEEGSIAGTVFRLSNRVSDAMKETMPGVGVYTIAYWDARNPPKNTKPNDNVCVHFCVGGCNNHTYDHTEECEASGGNPRLKQTHWDGTKEPSSNVSDLEYFNKWAELTNNLYFWYYASNFNYLISPAANIFNIYNDFKYVASHGATGMYCEGSSQGFTFEILRGYLASRMMWDPYMSEEEFEAYLDEFLMIYYGDGWQNIRDYLDLQNTAGDLAGCWTNNFDWPWDMYSKEYFAEHFDEMKELFDKALSATEDETQRSRIEQASIHVYFLGLSATFEDRYENGDDASRSDYKKDYDYLWDYINTKGYLEGEREDGYRCTAFLTGPGALDNFPENSDIVIDTMRWIFDDFTGAR
jgi:hypothetical protein